MFRKHYENTPMQYIQIFFLKQKMKIPWKNVFFFFYIFFFFAQNIDCGYTLEPTCRQSMFWSKNKKMCVPVHTQVLLYKSGV